MTSDPARQKASVSKNQLGLLLMKLTREFQRMHDERTEPYRKLGLRSSFGGVLSNLAQRPHRLSELAERNRMRPQSMVKIVNELESLSYVERVEDPSDARAKLVRFTADGRDMVAIASSTTAEIYDLYAEIVGEENLENLLSIMTRLLDGLEARD